MRKGTWRDLRPEIALVWRLSLPAILTQITTIVMQYIDSAMVGALGADASAAIGLVASSTWLFGGVTTAVSAGFSVQVAHRIGAGEDTEARTVVRHGLAAALTLAALLALLGLGICRQLPCWLGGGAEICADASAYFLTFSLMLPFSQLNSLTAGFLQCAGDMVTPSVLNAVMCGLDVVCNALLIPHFGVLGAGMGTALACALVSLAMAWCCCVRNAQLRLRRGEAHAFRPEILKKAFRIGAPVAVQEIAMNGAMVASTMILAPLGAAAIAPVAMIRSVVRIEGKDAAKKTERWQKIAREAVKQCARVSAPEIRLPRKLSAMREELNALDVLIVPWEDARDGSVADCLAPFAQKEDVSVGILIGPEGGIAPEEAEWLTREANAKLVTLGPRILRTETAAIASQTIVMALRGEME